MTTVDRHGDVVVLDPQPCKHCGQHHEIPTAGRLPIGVCVGVLADRADDDMRLPPGATCGGCANFQRCEWLIDCDPDSTKCDWSPSRYRPRRTL